MAWSAYLRNAEPRSTETTDRNLNIQGHREFGRAVAEVRMREVDEIRKLLDLLEIQLSGTVDEEQRALRNIDALELPELVKAVLDFLQPLLLPYEAAIYWHLLRHSIFQRGTQYVRVSTRGLQSGVVLSSSGQSSDLSLGSVRTALQGLVSKGAIIAAGDTNRDGTLYKICLPEEISLCQEQMHSAVTKDTKPIDEAVELDHYNVSENRQKIFERDSFKCYYCQKQLTRFSATIDHIEPVSRGGDNSFDNLITACLHCNSRRGNRPVMDAIIDGVKTSG